ncbi:MAG TPA: hypothetical protein VHD39_04420 [Acidimicrobiales bacterium]|nr:hypothetical protein [Acidimicrobiales bacterium]
MSSREPQRTGSSVSESSTPGVVRVVRVVRRLCAGALCMLVALVGALFVATPLGPGGMETAAPSAVGVGAPTAVTVAPGTVAAHQATLVRRGGDDAAGSGGLGGARHTRVSTNPATCPVVEMSLTASDLQGHAGAVVASGTPTCLQPVPATAGSSSGTGSGAGSGSGDVSSASIGGTGSAAVSQTIGISILPAPSPVP